MNIEFFPDGYIALNKELSTGLHPKLEARLRNHPQAETDVLLAEIATYCDVILDGSYDLMERDKLCSILAGRLEVLRDIVAPQVIRPLN